MALSRMMIDKCECGQILIAVQPELRPIFDKLETIIDIGMKANKEKISIFYLDAEEATCPKCGQVYKLPPAETLDADRTSLGKWIKDQGLDDE